MLQERTVYNQTRDLRTCCISSYAADMNRQLFIPAVHETSTALSRKLGIIHNKKCAELIDVLETSLIDSKLANNETILPTFGAANVFCGLR